MSLQIWLPLTKDLRQQGLSNTTVTNNGTTYSSTGGKLGGNYTSTATNQTITVNFSNLSTALANGKTYSLSCWVKPTGNPDNGWVIKLGNNNCGLWWAKSEARWVWNENDNGKRCANPTISGDYTNWHHLAIVVDKTVSGKITTKQYVDGALAANYPGSTWDNSSHSQPAGTTITISPYVSQLNDVRLYDHCLSPMEVKELARGLVLHYPLNRQGWGQENLIKGTRLLDGDAGVASGVTKTDNAYLGFTSATYNNSSGTSYHELIYWNGKVVVNANEVYTVSFYAKSPASTTLTCYFYNNTSNVVQVALGQASTGSTTASTDGGIALQLTPNWTKYWVTWIFNNTTTSATKSLLFRCKAGNTELSVCGVKLEKGSIATPWCPNSSDTLATTMGLNSTIEYDCSGFGNNGTRTGTFDWTSDTSKYQVSVKFPNNCNTWIVNTDFLQITKNLTFSCWCKIQQGSNSNFSFIVSQGRDNTPSGFNIILDGTEYALRGSFGALKSGIIVDNTWKHIVGTYDGTSIKIYINGGLKNSMSYNSDLTYTYGPALVIGKMAYSYTSTANYFPTNGNISDVRIYATALSADDVKSLYQNSAYIDSSGNVYGAVHEEV